MADSYPMRVPRRRFFSPGQIVVLFGGSFDPPHKGHARVARAALRQLNADFIWWLVSPQNPLKERTASDRTKRVKAAQSLARHPKFIVSAEEEKLGTRYAVDTVRALKKAYPHVRFVWLIGADNLADLHRWRDWQGLMAQIPLAVYPRPGYNLRALSSAAARRFGARRLASQNSAALAALRAPFFVMLTGAQSPLASSALRRAREEN